MSNGTSQVAIITGNIGQDHELRYTPNGKAVLNMSVATSLVWTDKDGNKQTETEWHRCVLFGGNAENTAKYTGKGSKVQIIGRLRTRKWQDRDNVDRWMTEILCREIHFLDRKPADGKDDGEATSQPPIADAEPENFDNFDDIPF